MDPIKQFHQETQARVATNGRDSEFQALSQKWLKESMQRQYVYNFSWMGRPVIQYPQDMIALQELVWTVKPDLIIETGIAHGGSLVLSASLLALLDISDAITSGQSIKPSQSLRKVIGIDIDIRAHNRAAIEAHPMASRIQMIQGSSIAKDTVDLVLEAAQGFKKILVCLDSMHTHDHVCAELEAYAGLVTPGSYCVVFDTFVQDMPKGFFSDRPWDVGNNPKTAVWEYLKVHPEFEIDRSFPEKLMVTVAPDGFLKRIR